MRSYETLTENGCKKIKIGLANRGLVCYNIESTTGIPLLTGPKGRALIDW